MNRRIGVVAALILAATGCGQSTTEPVAPPSGSESSATTDDLGKTYSFDKAADGTKVGSVRFTEVAELPSECLFDPTPAGAQPLAIRVELVNDGKLAIGRPDGDLLQVNDSGGFTQKTHNLPVRGDCNSRFPALAAAPTPGKAAGWAFIQSPIKDPAALVFTPLVWSETASITNWDVLRMNPTHVVVRLKPIPAAQPQTPAPASASAPITTTAAATPSIVTTTPPEAPAAGKACDPGVDNWANDRSGGQLKCAYAGSSSPKWIESAPFVGTRTQGSPCELGAGVAESPAGVTLVCAGDRGSATWTPGP